MHIRRPLAAALAALTIPASAAGALAVASTVSTHPGSQVVIPARTSTVKPAARHGQDDPRSHDAHDDRRRPPAPTTTTTARADDHGRDGTGHDVNDDHGDDAARATTGTVPELNDDHGTDEATTTTTVAGSDDPTGHDRGDDGGGNGGHDGANDGSGSSHSGDGSGHD